MSTKDTVTIKLESEDKSTECDQKIVTNSSWLPDVYINRAQQMLKHHLNGLGFSLYLDKDLVRSEEMVKNKVHIVYCKDHEQWIVASTVNNHNVEVLFVDPVFNSLDNDTRKMITNLFKHSGTTGNLDIKLVVTETKTW